MADSEFEVVAMRPGICRAFLILLATLALSVSACTTKDTNIIKVHQAISKFHGQFNAEQFKEMYADTDHRFRQSISENDFVAKLSELRRQYGKIQSSNINGFEGTTWWQRRFPNYRPTRFIGISNVCENGRLQEFFQWDVRGNEAKLLEYKNEILSEPAN